jgi:uroporphyrinogen decarboxylase
LVVVDGSWIAITIDHVPSTMDDRRMPRFPALDNDLLLRAARGEKTERTPVWMMRQAGRYLPEYRALRSEEGFFDLVRSPDLAAEATLQPIRRFEVDAAIIFSDILVVPQAMGLDVDMVPGSGPQFRRPLEDPADLRSLREPDVSSALAYVFEALSQTRILLDGRVPLIGFCGAPWTLMAYMVEGGGSKTFSRAKSWLFRAPEASHELLTRVTDVLVEYLRMQADSGAQALQVFDSWAGVLAADDFRTFAMPYLARIAEAVGATHPDVPLIVFARGANQALAELAGSGYHVVGLDWTVDPAEARRAVGLDITLQGNLDPSVLYAEPETIRRRVRAMLERFGTGPHIANLGHGMHPDHDPEHARAFVDAVHQESEALRAQETPA